MVHQSGGWQALSLRDLLPTLEVNMPSALILLANGTEVCFDVFHFALSGTDSSRYSHGGATGNGIYNRV
jgi:hypothetical protein